MTPAAGDGAQLPLEPEQDGSGEAKLELVLEVPARLVKLVRRLEPLARHEFGLRAPIVLQKLLDQLVDRGRIPDRELHIRLLTAEREAEELHIEQQARARKRRTCPHCRELDGQHLPACEAART